MKAGWGRYRHGECNTKLYQIWGDIIQRCTNSNSRKYKNYGAKGITVCNEWLDFLNFKKDMELKYLMFKSNNKQIKTSIERINKFQGYSSKNCVFVPLKVGGVYKHGECNTKLYHIWRNMKTRCINPKNTHFKYYGGKGITVDSKWDKFLGFKEDMHFKFIYAKKKYKTEDLSIERENINKNYCMENCSFIPRNQQARNTGKNKKFIATNLKTGEKIITKNQREFSRTHKINHRLISHFLSGHIKNTKCGWNFNWI